MSSSNINNTPLLPLLPASASLSPVPHTHHGGLDNLMHGLKTVLDTLAKDAKAAAAVIVNDAQALEKEIAKDAQTLQKMLTDDAQAVNTALAGILKNLHISQHTVDVVEKDLGTIDKDVLVLMTKWNIPEELRTTLAAFNAHELTLLNKALQGIVDTPTPAVASADPTTPPPTPPSELLSPAITASESDVATPAADSTNAAAHASTPGEQSTPNTDNTHAEPVEPIGDNTASHVDNA
jgi:hypothetical protein